MSVVPVVHGATPARAAAALAVDAVVHHGRSLARCLEPQLEPVAPNERALARELAFGTLRWQPRLARVLERLLERPLRRRQQRVAALAWVGLYQLTELGTPAHVAVSQTVAAAPAMGIDWARGLLNAVLRGWTRRGAGIADALADDPVWRHAHPAWWIAAVRAAWPDHWQALLEAANRRPPMTLRVNRRRTDRDTMQARLAAAGLEGRPVDGVPEALRLAAPVPVDRLPGFREGLVSVQDAAAQLAAGLLALAPGQRVLDACAAPGGKTGHLCEREPGLAEVVALDRDRYRLQALAADMRRLGHRVTARVADAADPASWWDGAPFDRILLDAPCTGSGVVRRHPDIPLTRRADDLRQLGERQLALLEALWPLLAPGGRLLFVTCSLFPGDSTEPLQRFLAAHPEARQEPLPAPPGISHHGGLQTLPLDEDFDGFFHALLARAQ